MAKKVLLASCGNRKYDLCKYFLEINKEKKIEESEYSFLSIARILNIDNIYLLLTPEARDVHEPKLNDELLGGINLKIVSIDMPKSLEEIWLQFDNIIKLFDEEAEELEIYLDITFALRHLPFIYYTSAMYLEFSSQNKTSLKGIYYGANEAKQENGDVPIFDITNLKDIIHGSFVVKEFETTGHISGLKTFMDGILEALTKRERVFEGKNGEIVKLIQADRLGAKNKDNFVSLEKYILNGLTFESGIASHNLLEKLSGYHSGIKAVDNLLKRLTTKLEPTAIEQESLIGVDKEKTSNVIELKDKANVRLTKKELRRELDFIGWHIEIGNVANSLVLLREWLVNRVLLANIKQFDSWIEYGESRNSIENLLNFYCLNYKKYSNKPFFELLSNWYNYSATRNKYAHAGFRNDVIDPNKDMEIAKDKLYNFCCKNIENDEIWRLPHSIEGSVALLTPMGASFGLLYTALRKVKADKIIVLTSEIFKEKVTEVCEKAGVTDIAKVKTVLIKDAFCGFDEANELCKDMLSELDDIGSCKVNLTGGTTAMQWAMQRAFEEFKNCGKKVKRIAFVDRRSSVEQQSNPFVEGELIEVDK